MKQTEHYGIQIPRVIFSKLSDLACASLDSKVL